MSIVAEDIKIEGHVTAYKGIPQSLVCKHGEKYLRSLKRNNPGVDVAKFIKEDDIHERHSNLVLTAGKTLVLERLGGGSNYFQHVVVGDGAFTFNAGGTVASGPVYPVLGDTDLKNPLAGRPFDTIEDAIGNMDQGFERHILTTFFSNQDVNQTSPWTANNDNRVINEIGLAATESGGNYSNYLAYFVMNNYNFSPAEPLAITFEWIIRVL